LIPSRVSIVYTLGVKGLFPSRLFCILCLLGV